MADRRASGDPRRNQPLRTIGRIVTQASAASVTSPEPDAARPAARTPGPARPRAAHTTRAVRSARRRGRRGGRWRLLLSPVTVIVVLMVLIASGLVVERVTGVPVLPSGVFAGLRPPPREFPVLPASQPVTVRSQAIQLDAPVHNVGLASDGTIAAPSADRAQEAGWYDQGPTPGQYGPAVIVGHVDTRTGPAVFHNLVRLRPGDRVEVSRQDGTVAIFEVDSTKSFDKAQLPVAEVYEDFSRPNLRLITCGGRWVGGTTGYADNLIVFASLVDSRPA